MHQINYPTPVGRTKIRPLTCCVISLAQYINVNVYTKFSSILSIGSQDIERKRNSDINQGP